MILWLYFPDAVFVVVLHMSACSIRCLLSPFHAISRRFAIRVRVGDDILDIGGLLLRYHNN